MVPMIKEIVCLTCRKQVKAKIIAFGFGAIGICPECKKLAYNGKLPS
jgi:hypothetical protein